MASWVETNEFVAGRKHVKKEVLLRVSRGKNEK
jgi:hypothetical protein